MVLFLKRIYEKDILEEGREKAAALGIHKDGGGLRGMGHKAFPVIPGSAVLHRYTRLP
jgi:hypothetical protein